MAKLNCNSKTREIVSLVCGIAVLGLVGCTIYLVFYIIHTNSLYANADKCHVLNFNRDCDKCGFTVTIKVFDDKCSARIVEFSTDDADKANTYLPDPIGRNFTCRSKIDPCDFLAPDEQFLHYNGYLTGAILTPLLCVFMCVWIVTIMLCGDGTKPTDNVPLLPSNRSHITTDTILRGSSYYGIFHPSK